MKKELFITASVAVILSAISFTSAIAQEANNSGEVIVTAQKRSENAQKASIAVSVVSAKTLERQGLKNAVDLQVILPTIKFQDSSMPTVSIRGVGTNNINAGVDASVAYSVDGVYLSHSPAMPSVFFDIERIEALSGPQGTLYGRNSNGGVLNLLTKNPKNEFEGYISAEVGNYNSNAFQGMVNLPISDTLALRIAAASSSHDAYHDDGFNDANDVAARAKLSWKPTENFNALLSLDYSNSDSRGWFYSYCPSNNVNPNCAGVAWQPFAGEGVDRPDAFADSHNYGVALTLNYDLSWATLTSITSYKYYKQGSVSISPSYGFVDTNGAGGTDLPGFFFGIGSEDEFITQELRLSSPSDSKIKWVGGLYYSNEDQPAYVYYEFPAFGTNFLYPVDKGEYVSAAIFGDITYPVTDAFRIRAGLRYTEETKELFGTADTIVPGVGTVASIDVGGKSSLSKVTWKLGFDYDITPSNLLYFTASTGFKSGGVNPVPTGSGIPLNYEPETIESYELGSKNRFFDNMLQINLSIYHYDYKGLQVYSGVPTASGLFFATLNSQKATFQGAEIELRYRPTNNDTLNATLVLSDSKYDEFSVPVAGINASGNEAAFIPKEALNLGYSHRSDLGNGRSLEFAVNTEFVGKHYVDFTNNPGGLQEAYSRTGASLTWSHPDGWDVTAYVRNIEDEGVMNSWQGPAPGELLDNAGVDAPRTYGFSIKKTF